MLSLLKNLNLAQKNVKKNLWKREDFISQQVSDLKVGVIGLGRLGLKFSKYCNSLSMKVYGYDIKKIKHQKYINRVKNMKYIFVNCDIISIHVDFNKYNKNLISKKYLKLMKKNSFIINTSRGELIDENFLHYLVKKKKIAGAGLDVLSSENKSEKQLKKDKLISLSKKNQNLIVTPHIGGYTYQAIHLTRSFIVSEFLK